MTRKDALNVAKFAGYHGDSSLWTRTYIDARRVSMGSMKQAWRDGERARELGMPCGCGACNS